MNILDKIIAQKKIEVAERKALYPTQLLEKSIYFETPVESLKKYLLREDKLGIIAEFKRRSPSKGDINLHASVENVSIGYMQAGASALSVLTDEQFFGGKREDLTTARKFNFCPILRKDFVIDEYQLIEAKSMGADAVLLIAACLDKTTLHRLAVKAKQLGLEVLMEIHSIEELAKLSDQVDVLGVNNRDLKTFEVSIQHSIEMAAGIPKEVVRISESGIHHPEQVIELQQAGFQGFLIGELFMKTAHPQKTCAEFVNNIYRLQKHLVWK